MAEFTEGLTTNRILEAQLLKEFRNYKDDFIGTFKSIPKKAIGELGVHFNKLTNNVGFHVNKDSDFTPKPMKGTKGFVEFDKLDTDPTEITDKELRGLAFDKESEVKQEQRNSFKIGVRNYSMHKIAPKNHVAGKMPVIRTTGDDDGTGRLRLTYSDLVSYFTMLERLNLHDTNSWYMILNSFHRGDLWFDRASTNNYRDVVLDTNTGMIKSLGKIKFFENNHAPLYNEAGVLKPLGAKTVKGDQQGSVFYYAPNTAYHIESVTVLAKPFKTDTRSKDPKSEMRLHSYGLCDKKQEHGFGALVSGNKKP